MVIILCRDQAFIVIFKNAHIGYRDKSFKVNNTPHKSDKLWRKLLMIWIKSNKLIINVIKYYYKRFYLPLFLRAVTDIFCSLENFPVANFPIMQFSVRFLEKMLVHFIQMFFFKYFFSFFIINLKVNLQEIIINNL